MRLPELLHQAVVIDLEVQMLQPHRVDDLAAPKGGQKPWPGGKVVGILIIPGGVQLVVARGRPEHMTSAAQVQRDVPHLAPK